MSTIIVTGYGRCGTTMLMQMLDAGGIPTFADSRASFEASRLSRPRLLDWDYFDGKAIKVLDPQRWCFPARNNIRFLFLTRDPKQQAKSQAKLLSLSGIQMSGDDRRRVVASLRKDYDSFRHYLPHVYLVLSFEQILREPMQHAERIAKFLECGDPARMAAVVKKRSPACLPDLSYEMGRVTAEMEA